MTASGATSGRPLRIALVFDALFPVTKGGAERWFTALATELARAGHEVTYVTTGHGDVPDDLPFPVCHVTRSERLYTADGSRRLLPSLWFGAAVGWWLLRHRREFDAFYVHQTPLFSVIAARLALGRRRAWAVEWIEWWTREYWRTYAPGLVGRAGWLVQRLALRATPRATVFARSTEARLHAARPDLQVVSMPGQLLDLAERSDTVLPAGPPLVLVVGRLVREKHAAAAIAAVTELARSRDVRLRVIGQGPLLSELRAAAAESQADIEVLGPVDQETLDASYAEAAVLLHASEREGFGLVVTEAAARGVPVVVVDGPDNAAVELVEPGVNGYVSAGRTAAELAAAVAKALDGGEELRRTTAQWFHQVAVERSVTRTAERLTDLLRHSGQAGAAR